MMCKLIRYKGRTSKTKVDYCMVRLIERLGYMLHKDFKTVACCCGHSKYPKTIIIRNSNGNVFELFTGKPIMRKKRFYRKDKEGYYFIPEVE